MSTRAADLPKSIRDQLLHQIREHVGEPAYKQLVSSLGEDGVVEATLREFSDSQTSSRPSSRSRGKLAAWVSENRWDLLFWTVAGLLAALVGVEVAFGFMYIVWAALHVWAFLSSKEGPALLIAGVVGGIVGAVIGALVGAFAAFAGGVLNGAEVGAAIGAGGAALLATWLLNN